MTAPRGIRALAAALLVLGAQACIPLPRYPAVEPHDVAPAPDETFGLDPWLLAEGVSERVAVEIDWVAGCKPGPRTVEGLRDLLLELGPPGWQVEVLLDDEIPREVWDELREGEDPDAVLIGRYADQAGAFDATSRVEVRYALFVPGRGGLFGYSGAWPVTRADEHRLVRGVVVHRDEHTRFAVLWISLDRIERMTLIHEFGHQLGLVSNESHERKHPAHRHHCTGLGCLMSHPTARVEIRNAIPAIFNVFPTGYCKRCRADIRQAQEVWRRELAADPAWRDGLVAAREFEIVLSGISRLLREGQNERVLEEAAAARPHLIQTGPMTQLDWPRSIGPDATYGSTSEALSWLASYEVYALVNLGRLDEALARVPELSFSETPQAYLAVGYPLIIAGRHEEVVALLDREAMRRSQDYTFETSFGLLHGALVGAGRYAEAADLVRDLLARGHYYFDGLPGSWDVTRADLLRRAGRNDEALALVRRGLEDRKTREHWTSEASARILAAAGHPEEALALRRQVLQDALQREKRAKDEEARMRASLSVGFAHAALGASAEARAALDRAGPIPIEPQRQGERWLRVEILARLGDFEAAAELMRDRAVRQPALADPCGEEDLEPMLADERFADVVGHCPLAAQEKRP